MILVDSSVWIDHLRNGDPLLQHLLDDGRVLAHALVIGEIAVGHLRQRRVVVDLLLALPRADAVTDDELLIFVDRHALHGRGLGLVDAHLLAAVRLIADASPWTRDKRLVTVARHLGVAAALP